MINLRGRPLEITLEFWVLVLVVVLVVLVGHHIHGRGRHQFRENR